MLGVKNYSKDYLKGCRKKIKTEIEEFQKLKSVPKDFETIFFNNMVLVLEQMFVHRLRGVEGKDGNPCNEVRMISNSILTNNAKLLADNTIKYAEGNSVLRLKLGDKIATECDDFIQLSKAFFDEIEKKFV
jgi:hypothetical protein